MKLHYHLVDVFTDRAFGGNPLAVFSDGAAVPEAAMQLIARELNLSETTFVLPPQNKQNNFGLRIFTPARELPMAGHPTVGAAFVLEKEELIPRVEKINTLRLEERIGVIRVSIRQEGDAPVFIEMTQPLPKFGPVIQNRDRIAQMLSLNPKEVHDTGLPIQTVSCGGRFCSCLFATSPPHEKYTCARTCTNKFASSINPRTCSPLRVRSNPREHISIAECSRRRSA
jgi:trans-2,3-dihydro-3-hydroxyanthranilate isomerase